jgi:hypothetical protein
MRRLKIAGLILAGMLAITPAAFAHGFGGGGFHGGGHYGSQGGTYAGHSLHNGNWYGGHWYGGHWYGDGYWYSGPYYGWGYPYGLGYYNYDYYGDPYSYTGDQTSNNVTASLESTVVAVQRKLAQLGYYHGRIDGIDGPETQKAIRWFQSTDKIAITGQINDQTLKALQIS